MAEDLKTEILMEKAMLFVNFAEEIFFVKVTVRNDLLESVELDSAKKPFFKD